MHLSYKIGRTSFHREWNVSKDSKSDVLLLLAVSFARERRSLRYSFIRLNLLAVYLCVHARVRCLFAFRDKRRLLPATMFLGVFPSAGTRFLQIGAGLVATLAGVSCYSRSSLAISQSAFSAVVTDFCFVRFLSVPCTRVAFPGRNISMSLRTLSKLRQRTMHRYSMMSVMNRCLYVIIGLQHL